MNLLSTKFRTYIVIAGCPINFPKRKNGQNAAVFDEFSAIAGIAWQKINDLGVFLNLPFYTDGMDLFSKNFRIFTAQKVHYTFNNCEIWIFRATERNDWALSTKERVI